MSQNVQPNFSRLCTRARFAFFANRDKMTQAFEFALDKVGLDFNSYQVRFVCTIYNPNILAARRTMKCEKCSSIFNGLFETKRFVGDSSFTTTDWLIL